MRHDHPFIAAEFPSAVRDSLGGIDRPYYERRARIERDREIDSLTKWFVARFTRRWPGLGG